MSVFGIDPGMAACGWAVIDPPTADRETRVIAFGVVTTEQDAGVDMNLDRQRRIALVGAELARLHAAHGSPAIAAEDMLSHGNVHAVVPQVLCWGAIASVAAVAGVELRAVLAKDWQHAVVPRLSETPKAKRYARVLERLRRFVDPVALAGVPHDLQTHALDAVGVAVFAALRRAPARRVCRAQDRPLRFEQPPNAAP